MSHAFLKRLVILAGLGGSLTGCCSSSLEAPALRAYVQDPAHGLVQHTTVGSAELTCAYRPTELLVAQELANPNSITASPDSVRRQFAGRQYFTLSLAQDGAEIENQFITNPTALTNALAYLNTGIAADVFLVTAGHDSIPALTSAYPRQYGATGRSTVLLIFQASGLPQNQDFQLVYRDTHFGLGTVQFSFKGPDVVAIPTLKLP
ncbi:hypothetical protein [Hymenobacter sp. DG01]|uniref:hypothetical protein n=1 Tax=Hymenobacter sp. DG01 TaxID=2584940 RepID=UPI001122D78F|nr:hypothetical protein [Hymenobacter sp. DG01]